MMPVRKPMRPPLLSRFSADCRAVAATELALILPVMLIAYLGCIEVSQLIGIDRKTVLATRTAADLTSRVSDCKTSTVPSEISGVLKASDAVVAPYDAASLSMVVSCVSVDKSGTAKLMWSYAKRGTPRTSINSLSMLANLGNGVSTTYWVVGEATYAYQPIAGYVLSGTYNLTEQVVMNSRL
jgi:Flp pilus assembly protein TadG